MEFFMHWQIQFNSREDEQCHVVMLVKAQLAASIKEILHIKNLTQTCVFSALWYKAASLSREGRMRRLFPRLIRLALVPIVLLMALPCAAFSADGAGAIVK